MIGQINARLGESGIRLGEHLHSASANIVAPVSTLPVLVKSGALPLRGQPAITG